MNKYAVITGGSRGIGKAISIQLAKDGYIPIIIYKNNIEAAEATKKEIVKETQLSPLLFQIDLADLEQIKKFITDLKEYTKEIDVLVNNAAISQFYNLEDTEDKEISDVVNIVLTSKIFLTKYLLPFLKNGENSSIINIASRMGLEKTIEGIAIYGPAEAGIIKFSKCCALEFAPYKIRVNSVAPGLTDTDLTRNWIEELGGKEKVGKENPSGRIGEPEDIANVVSFLASEKGRYINVENIGVNGGSNLG